MYSFKLKLEIVQFVLLSVLTVKISASCSERDDKNFVCSSIEQLKEEKLSPDWKVLEIFTSSKVDIKENTFANAPNITKLVLNGAVKSISRNGFKGLDRLHQLQLFNNDIPELKSKIFAGLHIGELLIYTSNVQRLKPRCFDDLLDLKAIFIHQNSISNVPAGVFSYTDFELVFLNDNKIQTIEEEAFFGMEKLFKLALEANFLTSFDANLYVGNTSPNLHTLWLARNNFTTFDKNIVGLFPNMKVLLMHINNIESIENGTFDNNKELKYIDLSNNKLKSISHHIFPVGGLDKMDILFLQNNRFIKLSVDVIGKLPNLRKIAIGGNPWLCPCYHELKKYLREKNIVLLCDDEYLAGKRPVCVSPSIETDKCSTGDENIQNLYDLYYDGQMDYLKLPPLCKVFCGNTSCYSHSFDVLQYQ